MRKLILYILLTTLFTNPSYSTEPEDKSLTLQIYYNGRDSIQLFTVKEFVEEAGLYNGDEILILVSIHCYFIQSSKSIE